MSQKHVEREARVAALRQLRDAAAAKGTQALNDWWDSLSGDDEALLTIAMNNVWKQTAAKIDRIELEALIAAPDPAWWDFDMAQWDLLYPVIPF